MYIRRPCSSGRIIRLLSRFYHDSLALVPEPRAHHPPHSISLIHLSASSKASIIAPSCTYSYVLLCPFSISLVVRTGSRIEVLPEGMQLVQPLASIRIWDERS